MPLVGTARQRGGAAEQAGTIASYRIGHDPAWSMIQIGWARWRASSWNDGAFRGGAARGSVFPQGAKLVNGRTSHRFTIVMAMPRAIGRPRRGSAAFTLPDAEQRPQRSRAMSSTLISFADGKDVR